MAARLGSDTPAYRRLEPIWSDNGLSYIALAPMQAGEYNIQVNTQPTKFGRPAQYANLYAMPIEARFGHLFSPPGAPMVEEAPMMEAAASAFEAQYMIQAGAFTVDKHLRKRQAALQQAGFATVTHEYEENGIMLTRLYVGPFPDAETASAQRPQVDRIIGERGFVTNICSSGSEVEAATYLVQMQVAPEQQLQVRDKLRGSGIALEDASGPEATTIVTAPYNGIWAAISAMSRIRQQTGLTADLIPTCDQ